ncbi:arylmalonate decarboxylase [Kitasatospora sp. NPDC054939]
MGVSPTPRIGIVVPPENPTAEPEFTRYFGSRAFLHTARFPVLPGVPLRDTLEAWNEALPGSLDSFGALALDAAVVACSASHYLLDPDGDRAYCRELGERAGFPVQSSAGAVLSLCAALGITRLTLVSPYEPWLTEVSRGYWEKAGLTVDRVVQVTAGDLHDPYLVTTEDLLGQLCRAGLPGGAGVPGDGGALLFTGTGMYTLEALELLEAPETLTALEEAGGSDRPAGTLLLSSNLASAWWARRAAGVSGGPGSPDRRGLHPLLGRLAELAA